ncbi:uncharacterized protein LOC135127544 isoform X1 [Zophobas morio]|uniref:uncharacterized protein LOC135127544 isoform X1 n=2 Tax=Zophobas morio TaxID=2755281 RepID=UPI003082704E
MRSVIKIIFLYMLGKPLTKNCTLPPYPEFGRWTIHDDGSSKLSPGQQVPPRTTLNVTCEENYRLDTPDVSSTCIRGNWTPKIGKCLRTCSTLHGTSRMTVTCTFGGTTLDFCANAVDGTLAQFQCSHFYEIRVEKEQFRVCSNGSWSGTMPTCVPVCGKPYNDRTLIVRGNRTKKGDYPWQVALYRATTKKFLCGGTLLNERVILTAAHCVTDSQGKLHPERAYVVAVGKYYRQYDNPDDKKAQFCSVHKMFVPRQYKASLQNYRADIALIVTSNAFTLSMNVQPVCVAWKTRVHEVLTDPNRTKEAYISGWGFTEEYKTLSSVLRHLKVPLIAEEDCSKRLSGGDLEYLTDDKMCAGFINSSSSVCKGDSGGGLVALYENRYHVIGIASISPKGDTQHGGCDSQHYTLYTKFSDYIDKFIHELEAQFRPSADRKIHNSCAITVSNDTSSSTKVPFVVSATRFSNNRCILPHHPQFGKWTDLFGFSELQPGLSVPSGTTVRIKCNRNFTVEGYNQLTCENGAWSKNIGRCLRLCPSLFSTPAMKVICSDSDNIVENCTQAVEGTIARFQCAPFYKDPRLEKGALRICTNGTWNQELPQCRPECGQVLAPSTNSSDNGTTIPRGYPWHVAIYRSSNLKRFICSGSLLSERIVLTARNCVSLGGSPYLNESFILAVAKMYNSFDDPREMHAQFSEAGAIFLPSHFRGQNNTAILIAKKAFVLSSHVLPVCLNFGTSYKLSDNEEVYYRNWTTKEYVFSEVAEGNQISLIPLSNCRGNTSGSYASDLESGQLCARSLTKGTKSFLDVGKGVVRKHDDKYYLVGVITGPALGPKVATEIIEDYLVSVYKDISKQLDLLILRTQE